MRIIILFLVCLVICIGVANAQTPGTGNTLGTTGVTAIQSSTNANYKLTVGGAVKLYGVGGVGTATAPSLLLTNTTAATGRGYGIHVGTNGVFQIYDTTAPTAPRLIINNLGNIGLGIITNPTTFGSLLNLGSTAVNSKLAVWDNGTIRSGLGWQTGQLRLHLSAATDKFSFLSTEAATTDLMTILGSGNVGIGISPLAQFHTTGTVRFDKFKNNAAGDSVLTTDAAGNLKLKVVSAAASGWNLTGNIGSTTANYLGTNDNISLRFRTNNLQRMILDSSGNIGIGIAGPLAQLHTTGTVRFDKFKNNAALDSLLTTDVNGNVIFKKITVPAVVDSSKWTLSGANIFSKNTGNVGIGTTIPSQKLDVAGKIKASDDIYANGANGLVLYELDPANYNISRVGTQVLIKSAGDLSINAGAGPILAKINNVEKFRIAANGNVGIGVNTPLSQLHTNGTIRFDNYKNNAAGDSVLATDANGNLKLKIINAAGITSLNGLTVATQTFATGTAGTDFGISSAGTVHTFNLPTASTANRGLLSPADWTTFNSKAAAIGAGGYIQNQFTGAQSSSNFWINGIGRAQTFTAGSFNGDNGNGYFGNLFVQDVNGWALNFQGGAAIARFNNTGIGIGTIPSAQLHTTGTVRFDKYKNNTAGDSVLTTDASGNLILKKIAVPAATDSSKWALSGANIFSKNSGNVGIGVTNPTEKLTIAGNNKILFTPVSVQNQTSSIGTDIYDNMNLSVGMGLGKSITFGDLSSSWMARFAANGASLRGNVGIGIDNPLVQLHTNGAVRFENYKNNAAGDSVLTTDANGNLVLRSATSLRTPLTFSDGLTSIGDSVKIGGALTENTSINVPTNKSLQITTDNTNTTFGDANSKIHLGANYTSHFGTNNTQNWSLVNVYEKYGVNGENPSFLSLSTPNINAANGFQFLNFGDGNTVYPMMVTKSNYRRFGVNIGYMHRVNVRDDSDLAGSSGFVINVFKNNDPNAFQGFGLVTNTKLFSVFNQNYEKLVLNHDGKLKLPFYANNAAGDSVLTTDANGNLKLKAFSGATGSSNWSLSGKNIYNNNLGNVGINTINPKSSLHVRGANATNWGIFSVQDSVNSGDNGQALVTFFGADSNRLSYFGQSYSHFVVSNEVGNGAVDIAPINGSVILGGGFVDNGKKLQVNGSGYIRDSLMIGTTNPLAQLHTTGTVRFDAFKNNAASDSVLTTDSQGNLKLKVLTGLSGGNSNLSFANGLTNTNGTVSVGGIINKPTTLFIPVLSDTANFAVKGDLNGQSSELGIEYWQEDTGPGRRGLIQHANPFLRKKGQGFLSQISLDNFNGSIYSVDSISNQSSYYTFNPQSHDFTSYTAVAGGSETSFGSNNGGSVPTVYMAVANSGKVSNQFLIDTSSLTYSTSINGIPRFSIHNDGSIYMGGKVNLQKFSNNISEDSVLTTDVNGDLKLKALTGLSGGNDISKWLLKNKTIYSKDSLNVGIGVDSALAKFHVNGSVRLDRFKNNPQGDSVLTTDIDGNLKFTYLPYGSGGGGGGTIYNFANGVQQVNGTVSLGGLLQDSAKINLNDKAFHFNSGSDRVLSMSAAGNVGIGTTGPASGYKLLVNGDAGIGSQMDSVGSGNKLSFNGNGNQDGLFIQRTNTAVNSSELRVNIGDDGVAGDKFNVGYYPSAGGAWKSNFTVQANGQVGVGTSQVNSELSVGTQHGTKLSVGNAQWGQTSIITTGTDALYGDYTEIKVPGSAFNNSFIRMSSNGNVGIGTVVLDTPYVLAVNGKIRSKGLRVESGNWADFVFEPGYKMKTLIELEKFIETNKHLPEMPTTADVQKNGQDIGEVQVKLLQKIEELTLYAIEQNKKITALEEKNKKQEEQGKEINDLKKQLEELKNLVLKNK
jgi:hypothetical protein